MKLSSRYWKSKKTPSTSTGGNADSTLDEIINSVEPMPSTSRAVSDNVGTSPLSQPQPVTDEGRPPQEKKKRKVNVTFLIDDIENFDTSKVTKMKWKDNSQEPSQELRVEVVPDNETFPIQKYSKAPKIPRPDSGLLTILTTPDLNNKWADCSYMLKRKDEVKSVRPKGPTQKALLKAFLPYIKKDADYVLQEEDWDKLLEFSKLNGSRGTLLVPGKESEEKVVNGLTTMTKQKLETRVVCYRDTVCYVVPHHDSDTVNIEPGTQLHHHAICTYPACLSTNQVKFGVLRCKYHRGVERFGVVEFYDDTDDIISIFSSTFSYSVKLNSSEETKKNLFQQGATQSKWGEITKMTLTMNERNFGTSKEAEQYLATLQTSRLFAKMNGRLINGKEYTILNKDTNLAYKCESGMENFLRDSCNTLISCQLLDTAGVLPMELGRKADVVNDGEGSIYMQFDVNVNYSGIKPPTTNVIIKIASDKTLNCPVGQYEDAMTRECPERKQKYKLNRIPILINNSDSLKMTEDVVNLSNYIAHLYKLDNPLTGDDFVCLNKQVKTDLLVENWHLVQGFLRYFFSAEVGLTDV